MSKKPRMVWRIEDAAARASVYIYDFIGQWGLTANDFVKELNAIGEKPIDLHINSDGGDVFDALAIYAALKNHGDVTAYIDGLAASSASFIAMAAGKIVIAPNASIMIHEASAFAGGDSEDLQKLADLLDSTSDNIAEIYAERAGGTAAEWRSRMKAETWYRGQEAVDAGLADEVAASTKKQAARLPNQHRPAAMRIAAQMALGDTSTLGAMLASEVYEAITDCVEECIEDGTLTTEEAVNVTALIGPLLTSLEAGLAKLGLTDREVEGDDEEEMGGMGMQAPTRIAAVADPDSESFRAAFEAARLTAPTPSLQQLLEEHQREPLSAAFGR